MSTPPPPATTGQTILSQIGPWIRASLDIRTGTYRADDHGLFITDCFISTKPRKRGTISIRPSGQGFYEVTFQDLRGNTVEEHDAADLSYIVRLLKRKAGLK
jgi:hypothetical protein